MVRFLAGPEVRGVKIERPGSFEIWWVFSAKHLIFRLLPLWIMYVFQDNECIYAYGREWASEKVEVLL